MLIQHLSLWLNAEDFVIFLSEADRISQLVSSLLEATIQLGVFCASTIPQFPNGRVSILTTACLGCSMCYDNDLSHRHQGDPEKYTMRDAMRRQPKEALKVARNLHFTSCLLMLHISLLTFESESTDLIEALLNQYNNESHSHRDPQIPTI